MHPWGITLKENTTSSSCFVHRDGFDWYEKTHVSPRATDLEAAYKSFTGQTTLPTMESELQAALAILVTKVAETLCKKEVTCAALLHANPEREPKAAVIEYLHIENIPTTKEAAVNMVVSVAVDGAKDVCAEIPRCNASLFPVSVALNLTRAAVEGYQQGNFSGMVGAMLEDAKRSCMQNPKCNIMLTAAMRMTIAYRLSKRMTALHNETLIESNITDVEQVRQGAIAACNATPECRVSGTRTADITWIKQRNTLLKGREQSGLNGECKDNDGEFWTGCILTLEECQQVSKCFCARHSAITHCVHPC